MRRCAVMLALIPFATARGEGERFIFEVSGVISPAEPVANVRLLAAFGARDYAFHRASLDIAAAEPNWHDIHSLLPYFGQSPGVPARAGDRVEGAVLFQYTMTHHSIYADPANPIAIWEARFEVFDFTPRDIELWTDTSEFAVYPHRESEIGESRLSTFVEGAGVIRVIPAPAMLPAMGVALFLLAAARQRDA